MVLSEDLRAPARHLLTWSATAMDRLDVLLSDSLPSLADPSAGSAVPLELEMARKKLGRARILHRVLSQKCPDIKVEDLCTFTTEVRVVHLYDESVWCFQTHAVRVMGAC